MMADIFFNAETKEFHLQNDHISYILTILGNGQPGHVYFGKRIAHRASFQHFLQPRSQGNTPYVFEDDYLLSMDSAAQEYPFYGATDFRDPACRIFQENGSHITDFVYKEHRISRGKEPIPGLPACYVEQEDEAVTLELTLTDERLNADLILSYTMYAAYDAVCRSARFVNRGAQTLVLDRALSLSVDLPDDEWTMIQLDGAWARERHVDERTLAPGIQAVSSLRGTSSADHNPFLGLRRSGTTESSGEACGFALVYSGNFLAQAQVNRYGVTRVSMGIHPFAFSWKLEIGEEFRTPEAVMVYSDEGLNGMSRQFHGLFAERLVRGPWRGKERPIVLNNWEATYFNFNEEKILQLADSAKELGVEMFVLDDGWFGHRDDATSSLGDWYSDLKKLPEGVEGLSKKITAKGLKFGLWIEPEMISRDSDLYAAHPEWAVHTPDRRMSHGRCQYVLDFSNKEVVDYIYELLIKVIGNSDISYIKWDMNRNITEAFSGGLGEDRQGEFFHRYILGVYDLYERLIAKFPDILFESCASGGARFDAGMLYYAPQAWASDDTDAVERLKIQYGTSMVYPVSSIGAHVSAVPNHQVFRRTDVDLRAAAAYFGAFGYELDPTAMSDAERSRVREQTAFYKKYRSVFQFGTFYRLVSPFTHQGNTAWMSIDPDQSRAVVCSYKVLARPNAGLKILKLQGLDPNKNYRISCKLSGEAAAGEKTEGFTEIGQARGDELMYAGLHLEPEFSGTVIRSVRPVQTYSGGDRGDYTCQMYLLEACTE